MKKFGLIFAAMMIVLTCFAAAPQIGQLMRGQAPDGSSVPIAVDANGQLLGVGGSGGGTLGLATDSAGNLKVNLASCVATVPVTVSNMPTGQTLNVDTVGDLRVTVIATTTTNIPVTVLNPSSSQTVATDSNNKQLVVATNIASDSSGNVKVNIASNSTVMIASIAVGIVLQDVRSIASNANTILADITSATAAPFWLMIRNTGTQKIHVDSVAPGDTTDYIGAGEQYGPVFFGTNVMNEKFRANSAGTSTWALTIRR